jgi:hypothetical protein
VTKFVGDRQEMPKNRINGIIGSFVEKLNVVIREKNSVHGVRHIYTGVIFINHRQPQKTADIKIARRGDNLIVVPSVRQSSFVLQNDCQSPGRIVT